MFAGSLTVLVQVFDESFVVNSPCLFQSWHSFSDLDVHVTVGVDKFDEVVVLNEVMWDFGKFYLHIFISGHWCSVVHVLDVSATKLCSRGRNGAVDE